MVVPVALPGAERAAAGDCAGALGARQLSHLFAGGAGEGERHGIQCSAAKDYLAKGVGN